VCDGMTKFGRCWYPTWGICINVFLWRTRRNMNSVLPLVYPVYDMHTYIFKVCCIHKTGQIGIEYAYFVPRSAYSPRGVGIQ